MDDNSVHDNDNVSETILDAPETLEYGSYWALLLLLIPVGLLGFFAYKLTQSLKDKERRKEEKKKLKQQRKEKEAKAKKK